MASRKSDKKTRDALFKEIRRLQRASISGRPIPMPQRTAMQGQAAALQEQWLELQAARFNTATAAYKKAIQRVETAIGALQEEIDKLDDAIKMLERSTAVIKAVDGLLSLAVRHLPII